MRPLRSTDVIPVSSFKAQAASCFERLAETGRPLVITQNGRPAGVLLSPSAFDALTERARFMGAVNEGLEDVARGRLTPHDEVVARFTKRPHRR
jgi:prevent-host-death family protein